MFLADVSVPVLNQIYDFKLDENMEIGILIEEIVEMICQKEQCQIFGNLSAIFLCEVEKKEIFSRTKTLQECGIHTGSRLMLV